MGRTFCNRVRVGALTFNKKPGYTGIDPNQELIDEKFEDNVVKIDWK